METGRGGGGGGKGGAGGKAAVARDPGVTQYIGDTHNARTLIPMNTRTRTLPLGASSKIVPVNPQD
jgi:hypothetical protein